MPDETPNQQDQQGAAQERAEQDQGQDRAGAQEPPTERDEVDQVNDVQALRHEAASRRRALRAVEAERDTLRERVDAHDRAEVEVLAGEVLADASDLWGAVDLDALRDEDGAVDFAAVEKSISELLRRKPHYAIQTPRVNLHQGVRQAEPERKSFGQALKRDGGR